MKDRSVILRVAEFQRFYDRCTHLPVEERDGDQPNDETQTVEKQYLQDQTMEDEGPLDKYYTSRNINDFASDVLICRLEKEMATKLNDVTQAGSECSFKVSDPRAILRICSSLFETDDVYSRSEEQP